MPSSPPPSDGDGQLQASFVLLQPWIDIISLARTSSWSLGTSAPGSSTFGLYSTWSSFCSVVYQDKGVRFIQKLFHKPALMRES
ncbi:hypothetical protein MUK42_36408, partial [Musa troglodytarum]